MSHKHIADGEGAPFLVLNIDPDFCMVDGEVVPFEIMQELSAEQAHYADSVHARGCKVLTVGSIIQGVNGDAGKGVISGTAMGGGSCEIMEGDPSVHVEKRPVARHLDLVHMNCS